MKFVSTTKRQSQKVENIDPDPWCDETVLPVIESDCVHRYSVPEGVSGRLDKVLAELMAQVSRSRIRLWIEEGAVLVNGQVARPRDTVSAGMTLEVAPPPAPEASAYQPEQMDLDIVYEDESVLVLNKPAGLVVHPAAGHWSGTLVNGLLAYDSKLAAVPRAGIVHRLDANTSGLMVVARSLEAHAQLVQQLQARSVRREYWALVYGQVPLSGTIATSIGRDPRNPLRFKVRSGQGTKTACTHFRQLALVEADGLTVSWVACRLETGRTHQIRVHLESIGHPLVGDPLYRLHRPNLGPECPEVVNMFSRQALHAVLLGLVHPTRKQYVSWHRAPPSDMSRLMRTLGLRVPRRIASAFE